jgi:putative endonuclease
MKRIGEKGEEIAVEFLKRRGHKIIEKNYSTRFGEVDIITRSPSGEICFIEVKSESTPMSGPFKLNRRKMEKIKTTALDFISKHKWARNLPVKFDFIWVNLEEARVIEYIEGGFE